MFKTLQKIGKAFMLPIAILPAAGLLLGIGGALSNPTTVKSYPVLDNPILQDIFQVMSAAGNVIFENLALLLSIGLCIGLDKRDKGTAALAGIVLTARLMSVRPLRCAQRVRPICLGQLRIHFGKRLQMIGDRDGVATGDRPSQRCLPTRERIFQ